MFYQTNKIASRTRTTKPTLTDQTQRASTDLNIIMKGYKIGDVTVGKGAASPPTWSDYSNTPADLRDAIEIAKRLPHHVAQLPAPLAAIPPATLITMTPAEISAILNPPKPTQPPTDNKEPKT